MADVGKTVGSLLQEAADKMAEAERLKALMKEFPDLQKYVGRWNKVAYYSKTVNEKVQRFDLRHNCGCCNDSPLEVWPYLETPHGKVYSDPPQFVVGERHWISGDVPHSGWKKLLQEAHLPEAIIGAISAHFREDAEYRKSLADDDDEEY